MFGWLRKIAEKTKDEVELCFAPPSMYPVGFLLYHGGHQASGMLAGIYRITRHKADRRSDSVLCCGTLELPLRLPKCAAAKVQDLLNQTECKCGTASEIMRKFHNEVEY